MFGGVTGVTLAERKEACKEILKEDPTDVLRKQLKDVAEIGSQRKRSREYPSNPFEKKF